MIGEVEIGDYIVEWDDNKNEVNFKKHGVRFRLAARVIGKVDKVLFVIYTERQDRYRLISARYANKKEVNEYYGQYSYL